MIQTRTALDRGLATMQANIVRISSIVEHAIDQSILAMETQNIDVARTVIAEDHEVNRLRYDVEEQALLTLATQSPRAGDLRRVIAAIHIAIELERMGDHAVGIAKLVERMRDHEVTLELYQLPKMAKRCRKMIRLAIDAFVAEDAEKALALMERDAKIDKGYRRLYANLIGDMKSAEDTNSDSDIEVATWMLWMGHNLERIGDRAVNIAERVVFMVTGDFVESPTTDLDIEWQGQEPDLG